MTEMNVEQRFQAYRKQIREDQFNDADYLEVAAKTISKDDLELSKRILVRVSNLRKKNDVAPRIVSEETASQTAVEKINASKATDQKKVEIAEPKESKVHKRFTKVLHSPFGWLVIVPSVIFALYQIVFATERYESPAQVIVQQPDGMATMDASLAILSGMGVSTGSNDTKLVEAFILSNDMLQYLDETLALRDHYTQGHIDYFSRLDSSSSLEAFLEYYRDHITVYVDVDSGVVHIYGQAFDEGYAQTLTQTIVERAEWYINSIGHQLAEAQLSFVQGEHALTEQKLESAQSALLKFQQRYNLLDPTAEGAAKQQITYTLEGQISAKEAELQSLEGVMSSQAPQVIAIKNEIVALKSQLKRERDKLSSEGESTIPVSEILAKYTDLKVKMELALQSYTSSQVSLEKSRIEAYRQLKYLVVVQSALKPQESKYPDTFYNISLFVVLLLMTYGVGRIVYSTVRELR